MKHLLITIAALVLVGCGPSVPKISIHQAAYDGNIEAVKQHLAAGTDVDARDRDGVTPLRLAAMNGHKEVVKLLIAKGANAKTTSPESTALHFAAMGGHKEIAELLIANGADVNVQDEGGFTPLQEASIKGHKEFAELLIAKGVDINAKVPSGPKQGLTALDAAAETNQPEIADLLRKHGGKTGEELKAEGK